jgi:hypothetical protein
MLTTQEALEAMAGRSPEGKPLVFVSRQDYDELLKKYELLLERVNNSTPAWQSKAPWITALASMGIAIVVAVVYHPVALPPVEPYGGAFYATNDIAGVHAANEFCMARKEDKRMKPLYPLGAKGLYFECVQTDDEIAAAKREAARKEAEPWQFTPSAENRARCIELRDQREQIANDTKGLVGLDALRDAAFKADKLDNEANTLKCWSKP